MFAKRVEKNNKRTESSIWIELFNEAGSALETSSVGAFQCTVSQAPWDSWLRTKDGPKVCWQRIGRNATRR